MTRARAIDALFPGGAPLFYQGVFQDQPFTKQWTVLGRNDATGCEIDFFLELDPKPLGQGATVMKERCRLVLDPELRPLGYGSEASGVRVSLTITDGKVRASMHDGTQLEVPLGGAGFIAEANITGLDAIALAITHARGELAAGKAQLQLFLLNQLMTIPYAVTRGEGDRFTSSHEEDLVIDDRGVLQSIHLAKASVRFTKQPAPAVPAWSSRPDGTRGSDHLRYLPPPDRTFQIQDVSIASRRGEVGGTLTIPRGTGPFPAVLFLSGTGTHDRHGMAGNIDIGTHEIVDDLSEHGFIGLRFDTRGAGTTKVGADALDSSLTPLIDHARAWFQYLANRPEVDPSRIVLVGHSQGGTVALLTTTGADRLPARAVALLATPGRPLHELLEDQIAHQARALGISDEAREHQLAQLREVVATVRAGKPFEPGAVPDRLVAMARQVAWFKDHLAIDPTTLVAQLPCPVLICQGAKDFQVSTRDAERLVAAARAAERDVEEAVFPDLDHLFKFCEGESRLDQYYDSSRRVDPAFRARLRGWLEQRCA